MPAFYLGNNAENEELRSMWAEGPTMWALRDESDTTLYGYSMHPTRGWLPDSTNELHVPRARRHNTSMTSGS